MATPALASDDPGKLADHIASLQSVVKTGLDSYNKKFSDFADQLKAAQDAAAAARDDVKKFGSEKGDESTRVAKLADSVATIVTDLQELKSDIDAARRDLAKAPISKGDVADALQKSAVRFFRERHLASAKSPEEAKGYDKSKVVTSESVKTYGIALKAMDKIFRTRGDDRVLHMSLSNEEMIALKTLNTGSGNQLWLAPEISDRVIECFEAADDVQAIFDSINISGSSVVFPIRTNTQRNAKWRCEIDCDPKAANFVVPPTLEVEAEELVSQACATYKLLEDALIDVPGWIANEIGRDFTETRNETFVLGNTASGGKIKGLLSANMKHICNGATLTPPLLGRFSWQDLVIMSVMLPARFQNNSSWLVSRTFLAAMLTMADANGQPIFSPAVIQAGGTPRIMGREVRVITQMPEYSDATGTPILNSIPAVLGDFKQAYRIVNRLGLSIERDPYSAINCGVVWHARARFGGAVTCSEAVVGLKICA